MKKIIILLLTIFLSNSISNATCWEQFSDKMFIDTDSIEYYIDDYGKIHPEQYTFWIKYLNDGNSFFTNAEKILHKKVWYMLSKTIVNTQTKRVAEKSSFIYDLKHQLIHRTEILDCYIEWQSIAPQTNGEELYYMILERNKQSNNKTIQH